ncbi:MAG: CCA tRNA nucleotidyltransferase [Deltaproteobacteria bacterium]|nr:CCA tRNA nucleotidyltransferase [Deltaproteobacteria bacterium]
MKTDAILQLKNESILRAIFDGVNAVKAEAYLVGGVLRNLALSRPLGFDYDIVLDGKVKETANLIAGRLKGSPFLLDKKLESYRVNVKHRDGMFNIDISQRKGKDIWEDLSRRDFTINALSVDMNALFKKKDAAIIDIFKGINDAENKIIRMLKPEIFDEDPLRLLRAVRLSAQYNLKIDKETEKYIQAKANLLPKSSWERIRDEFFLILYCSEAAYYVKKLHELSLLREIIPEIRNWESLKDYNLLSHSLKTLEQGENLYNNLNAFAPEFADNLYAYFEITFGNIAKRGLFKIALFLHDVGKAVTMKREEDRIRFIGHEGEGEIISKRIGKRLKLSRAAIGLIARLGRNHHRVFNLASFDKPTNRSKAHLFRVMGGGDGLLLLLLAFADARATRDGDDPELASLVRDLIGFYYKVYSVKKPKPILNGEEVMDIFNIPEGVIVGRILNKLAEVEGEGIVKSKRDAVKFINNWLEESEGE